MQENFILRNLFVLIVVAGDIGEVERAVPEVGIVRQFRRDLRVDQVRGKMEHRTDQRQKHAGHAFLVVPRWSNGSHMLQGNFYLINV